MSAAARGASAIQWPRRTTGHAVARPGRHKQYEQGAFTRKLLDVAQKYLELQRLRIEVERAELELKKRLEQPDERKKH